VLIENRHFAGFAQLNAVCVSDFVRNGSVAQLIEHESCRFVWFAVFGHDIAGRNIDVGDVRNPPAVAELRLVR
jgi:hypothetical protein